MNIIVSGIRSVMHGGALVVAHAMHFCTTKRHRHALAVIALSLKDEAVSFGAGCSSKVCQLDKLWVACRFLGGIAEFGGCMGNAKYLCN